MHWLIFCCEQIPRKWGHATYNVGPTISAQGDWFNRYSIQDMEIGSDVREFAACAKFFTKKKAADGSPLTLAQRCKLSSACEGHVGRSSARPVEAGLIHPKICSKFKSSPLWQQARRTLGSRSWKALQADLNCLGPSKYRAISRQREEIMLEDFTPELDRRQGRDDR